MPLTAELLISRTQRHSSFYFEAPFVAALYANYWLDYVGDPCSGETS